MPQATDETLGPPAYRGRVAAGFGRVLVVMPGVVLDGSSDIAGWFTDRLNAI